jgi:IclR family acetate operon transcriptional repressor
MADDRSMLARVLTVIEVCLAHDDALPLSDLARASGLPKPTAWRIAESLTTRGLLQRTADGYLAGLGLVELGNRAAGRLGLRADVTPELADLHARTGAAVWVVDVRSDSDWTLVDSVYDRAAGAGRYAETWPHAPSDPQILASAFGVLALADRPDLAEPLLRQGVPRLTPHTEVDAGRVLAAIDRARAERVVVEKERFRLGWSCLAVPVVDRSSGRTVSILGVVQRTPRFAAGRLARAAADAADALSHQAPPERVRITGAPMSPGGGRRSTS